MDEQSLERVKRWVEMMSAVLDEEEVEKQVKRAAEPRLRTARKLLRKHEFAVEPAEAEILKQERQKIKNATD